MHIWITLPQCVNNINLVTTFDHSNRTYLLTLNCDREILDETGHIHTRVLVENQPCIDTWYFLFTWGRFLFRNWDHLCVTFNSVMTAWNTSFFNYCANETAITVFSSMSLLVYERGVIRYSSMICLLHLTCKEQEAFRDHKPPPMPNLMSLIV